MGVLSCRGLLGAALLATTLTSTSGAIAQDTVKLGMVGPFTGPAANTGITARGAWQIVIDQVNAEGGITLDGKKKTLEIISADSQSKPSVGVAAAQKLVIRDNVDLLVGDMLHSDVSLALMELMSAFKEKILYIPLPVSSEISNRIAASPDKFPSVWKWDQGSEGYGITVNEFMAEFEKARTDNFKAKTFAVVSEQTDYSQTIIKSARELLEGRGWKLLTNEAVPIGHSDFYPQISKVRAANPDLILSIFTAANSGIAFVKQLKEQSLPAQHFAIYYPSFAPFKAGVGDAAENLLYAAVMVDPKRNPKHKQFADLMQSAKVQPTTDALLGYCSALVLVDALKRAGSVTAAKLNPALAATDNRECPNGIRLVFDQKTHSPILGPEHFFVSVGQIQGGEDVIVWPTREATGPIKP